MKDSSNNRHALVISKEYPQANFTWILSLVLAGIFLWNSFSTKTEELNPYVFALFCAYALTSVFQLFLTRKMKKDLLQTGEIRTTTRRLGYVQLVSLLTGNIFAAAFAFNLINKRKTPEYTVAVYMLLTQITVIAISSVNLFKPYVSDTFLIAMGILLLIALFYLVALILSVHYVQEYSAPRWMSPLAIVLMATAVTGNLFALLLGWSLFMKSRRFDSSRLLKWNVMWRKSHAILLQF